MKKLIHPSNLQEEILKYRSFVDEKCRMVTTENFITLFAYKYANGHDDMWQYWIDDNKLYCENISGFMITFPLELFKN
jgi:hypothetical protein